MAEVNLDIRAEVNIKAVKGDDFGPLIFIFKDAAGELEELTGATYTCVLKSPQGVTVHEFEADDNEIIFDEAESKLTIFLNEDVTEAFNQGNYTYAIKQTLNDVVITRLFGTISFKK